MALTKELKEKLISPFDTSEIKFKPTAIKDGKALALPYIDARTVLDRLDEIIGSENWQDEYDVVSSNQVICKLTIHGTTKSDAGEASTEDKEPLKSAVSDALKRAAVKFGIGRYLYRSPKVWYRFDDKKGEFIDKPILKGKSDEDHLIKTENRNNNVNAHTAISECAVCRDKITNRVAIFSKKYYQKPLCMKCQNLAIKELEDS
ncbi:MAG: Rad52/Rad22 family DNA repair protein [Candidatus Gastranaerophilales bacterium]|nr:Rad52/Rad22 family DNA repair protein [Candidatus Gastranaerophilales bacterium]